LLGIKINDNFTDHIPDALYDAYTFSVDYFCPGCSVYFCRFVLFDQEQDGIMQREQYLQELQSEKEQKQVLPAIQL